MLLLTLKVAVRLPLDKANERTVVETSSDVTSIQRSFLLTGHFATQILPVTSVRSSNHFLHFILFITWSLYTQI